MTEDESLEGAVRAYLDALDDESVARGQRDEAREASQNAQNHYEAAAGVARQCLVGVRRCVAFPAPAPAPAPAPPLGALCRWVVREINGGGRCYARAVGVDRDGVHRCTMHGATRPFAPPVVP